MPLGIVPKPLVVVILDGWGISFEEKGNAIAAAETPTMNLFARHYPTASLLAAGLEVGLPWGEKGNSETGHSNIGAGQVSYQTLPFIDKQIEDGNFFRNEELISAIEHVKSRKSRLHLMGLVSTGGIHSHINHLFALLELAKKKGLSDNVFVHVFTDGRDTPPQSAATYVEQLEKKMNELGVGSVATITGRLYAMDRNENWERTRQTYNLLTGYSHEAGAPSAQQALKSSYASGVYDEKILPTALTRAGKQVAAIEDGDAVIFFNFRPDRARQLTRSFVQPDFSSFDRKTIVADVLFVTMTQYDDDIKTPAAYVEQWVEYPVARVLSEGGMQQLHIAETEKYAHVTYYLNGGREEPFPGEKHVLVRSSETRDFDKEPEMKAAGITDSLLKELNEVPYDVVFVNYANADMVGHTGNFDAAIKACTFTDKCLRRLYDAVVPKGGALLVTADHGNAEEMINPQTGEMETDHTSSPVPIHLVYERLKRVTPRSDRELRALYTAPIGMLADVAPTILDILSTPKPDSMTGISLLNSLQ